VTSGSVTEVRDWLQVTDSDPGPSTIPVQNIECIVVISSTFGWTAGPIQYFELFFDMDFLDVILRETTLYGNKKTIQNTPSTRRAKITEWYPQTPADINTLCGVMLNVGLHPMSDITDYFSQAWMNRMPLFSDVFPWDDVLFLF
jgi:hypothetical protein